MTAELIARLGKATGSSRVLDFEISLAVSGDRKWPATDMKGRITNPNALASEYLALYRDVIDADDQDFDFPRYTGSKDAAISLIPDHLYWMCGFGKVKEDEPIGGCTIYTPGDLDNPIAEAEASSVELAICIAAMEAIAK